MKCFAPMRLTAFAIVAMLTLPALAQSGASQPGQGGNESAQSRNADMRRKTGSQEQEQATKDPQRSSLFTPEERKTLRDDIRQASKVIYSSR